MRWTQRSERVVGSWKLWRKPATALRWWRRACRGSSLAEAGTSATAMARAPTARMQWRMQSSRMPASSTMRDHRSLYRYPASGTPRKEGGMPVRGRIGRW
ncbi:hypothetical protein HYQ44_017707 [Verticillium longisporum]|nr:hypothetical protein HYQ44_017707 [Verticillium longisporum]